MNTFIVILLVLGLVFNIKNNKKHIPEFQEYKKQISENKKEIQQIKNELNKIVIQLSQHIND